MEINSGRTYECIVIGAGVIGCSAAYHLAKSGRKVLLLEQSTTASGASGAAAGMLAPDHEHFANETLKRLALRSRELYPSLVRELEELTGTPIGLNCSGFVTPALNAESADKLREEAGLFLPDSLQNGTEWWDSVRLRKEIPYFRNDISGAIYRRNELQLLPRELTRALLKGAMHYGARIRQETVIKPVIVSGRLVGLETDQGLLACEQAVIASGMQSGELLRAAGIEASFEPVKGEIVAVRAAGIELRHTVYAHDLYLVPKPKRELWIGATSLPGENDTRVSVEGVRSLLNRAAAWFPGLEKAELVSAWAGVRPKTADGLPYIGPLSQVEGLFAAAGHYRNGILLAAVTGDIVSRWITGALEGKLACDLAPFSPDRVRNPSFAEQAGQYSV
ncbi:glycine oxidase ThiO [Paenibacillus sp. JX-17]|uniref:glycine oxidase n=1 Tax=Paenibacillus lacisoli TaxID=3064525 RepID=A0ABT9C8A4_9BACL|nr:glycine oxidase ThiO [Paenibacillus sp. JX-17]MDO7904914.1 glycine oxidase ThiO [Paenibacillus sp. JX-17]